MGASIMSILKDKFPSKEMKVRKLESLRDQLCGSPEEKNKFNTERDMTYRDGVWDAIEQVIMLVKEGEL